MSLVSEFKDFINKGNVMDLAVGVIIGGAFGKIVTSLVEDIITPLFGGKEQGNQFTDLKLGPMNIGNFINSLISFLIIAFCVFLIVKAVNKMRKPAPVAEAAPAGPTDVELLAEIRDLLKK
jgi:large conductance mechanosensitive channel